MIIIKEKTIFEVPIEVAFDAERNISLHMATQGNRRERAIAGVTSGIIENGQEVEWEAIHFGIKQRLRVKITHLDKPRYFRDEQIFGAFKSFSHEHYFSVIEINKTEKIDILRIEAPYGFIGKIGETLFLKRYMINLLRKKNEDLKTLIEKKLH
jgi:ligand-binding SRPBCC domain-containing protein